MYLFVFTYFIYSLGLTTVPCAVIATGPRVVKFYGPVICAWALLGLMGHVWG